MLMILSSYWHTLALMHAVEAEQAVAHTPVDANNGHAFTAQGKAWLKSQTYNT